MMRASTIFAMNTARSNMGSLNITRLPATLFHDTTQLRFLDLKSNALSVLSDTIFSRTPLTTLLASTTALHD